MPEATVQLEFFEPARLPGHPCRQAREVHLNSLEKPKALELFERPQGIELFERPQAIERSKRS